VNFFNWLTKLDSLATRYAHFGLTADLAALTLVEAYALLALLRRIAGE
jgi:hypothetical protein